MNKQRIPPSDQIRQQIEQILKDGIETPNNPLESLLRLGAQLVVQEALEKETTERLGRAYYQRREPEEPLLGHRNGYEPGQLRTAEGKIVVQVPQVRDWVGEGPYRSGLMTFLRGNSDVLHRLAVEMYVRGLSVRDIEAALEDATGQPLLSRSAVSALTETLWEDYEAFCQRDLSPFAVDYLFIDAVYEGLRAWGGQQGVLCAWGICQDGRKVLLHLALGSRESYPVCLEFIRDMIARGLVTPVMVTTDGAPGLIRAVEEVWGQSLRQRCLAHKMSNIWTRCPKRSKKRSNGEYGMSSMPPRSKWPRSGQRSCCRTISKPTPVPCAASAMIWKLVWSTCVAPWVIIRPSVPPTCWSALPGEPAENQGDPPFLHRTGLFETGLRRLVAGKPAMATGDHDRIGQAEAGPAQARVGTAVA